MVAISNPPAKTRESVCADTPSAYGNARHYRMAGTAEEAMMTASGNSGRGLRAGRLSMTDNVVGYAGYIFNAELVSAGSMSGGGLYTVRHRHYAPGLGRWLSRDPLGYVDGMSLYEYVRGNPLVQQDFSGLCSGDCTRIRVESCSGWIMCAGFTSRQPINPRECKRGLQEWLDRLRFLFECADGCFCRVRPGDCEEIEEPIPFDLRRAYPFAFPCVGEITAKLLICSGSCVKDCPHTIYD